MNDAALKEILQTLLSEIAVLHVNQSVLAARLAPDATAADLLEAKKLAERTNRLNFAKVKSQIETL